MAYLGFILIVQLILFVIKFFVLIGDTAMASQPDLQCQDKDLKYLRKGKLHSLKGGSWPGEVILNNR